MKAKLFTLLIIFGLVLFIAPSASALSNPITISNSQNDTLYPQTVTDTSGYLHAVWMDVEPGKIWARHQNPGIFYSRWNGDIWSTPVSISNNTGFAEMPSISSDSTGTK